MAANAPTDGGSMSVMANAGSIARSQDCGDGGRKQATSASISTSGNKSLASIHRVALSRILFGLSKPKRKRIDGDHHLARSSGDERYNKNAHQDSLSVSSIQYMQKELLSLQRRKAFLRGEMERIACSNGMLLEDGDFNATESTVADEIESVRAQATEMESRPYLHQYDDRDGSGLLMTQKRKSGPPNMLDDVTGIIASTSELVSSTTSLPTNELRATHNDGSIERNNSSMTVRMHSVRKRRRIVASHRLAGISAMNLTQDDNGVIGARMDVCGPDGRFVAQYYVFFDAVRVREEQLNATGSGGSTKSDDFFTSDDALVDSNDDNNNQEPQDDSNQWTTFLRLVQHTLPPGVPATDIMKRNFPPQGMLEFDPASLQMNKTEEHSDSHEPSTSATMVMNELRQCIGDMYDACHVHVLRRDFFLTLKRMVQEEPESARCSSKQGDAKDETIVLIKNPLSTDAFDVISFDIKTLISDSIEGENQNSSPELFDLYLTVQLRYENMMHALPTEAVIRTKDQEESGNNDATVNIDSNTSTHFAFLFEQMRTHFLGLPLPGAIEKNIVLIRDHRQEDSCTGTL